MSDAGALRGYLAELAVVFIGVALAFAVENLREELNEKAVGEQYLAGFRQDLTADLGMLTAQQADRRAQLANARAVLAFFESRSIEPQRFFETYYAVLPDLGTVPHRNTMDEVLSSGGLRLIRDAEIRKGLLNLYASYDRIARVEEHMARDFDAYLYDPTFSTIPLKFQGPWEDTLENRRAVEALLQNLTVENGVRLVVFNLDFAGAGLLYELDLVRSQVERLLQLLPEFR
jgi:hypothetical protein